MTARAAFLSLAFSWRDARRQRAILRPTPPPPQRPALRRGRSRLPILRDRPDHPTGRWRSSARRSCSPFAW